MNDVSQTDFENDEQSMVVNVVSDSDDNNQHSDFSVNSSVEEYGDKLSDIDSFWGLEICTRMKKCCVNKIKKIDTVSVLLPHSYI